jgi:hypothetical protein
MGSQGGRPEREAMKIVSKNAQRLVNVLIVLGAWLFLPAGALDQLRVLVAIAAIRLPDTMHAGLLRR